MSPDQDHPITIATAHGPGLCKPDPERVRYGHTVTWTSEEFSDWRVIFGPNAPVTPRVLSPTENRATVTAKRPEDFHRHKYVVVVLSGSTLAEADPQLIVDENG